MPVPLHRPIPAYPRTQCEGFQAIIDRFCLDELLEVRDTSTNHDTFAPGDVLNRDHTSTIRPDIGWYPANHVDGGPDVSDRRGGKEVKGKPRNKWVGNVDWGAMVIGGEIKYNVDDSAFPNSGELLSDSSARRKSRGQLLDYAATVLRRQHRTFFYVIAITFDHARFIRVDREGALVSTAFNYIEDSLPFYRFFHNYKEATEAGRGFDPTATPLTSQDPDDRKFRELYEQKDKWTQTVRDALKVAGTSSWPIYRLEIDADQFIDEVEKSVLPLGEQGKRVRRFLIGRATFSTSSITGRATRIFPAYDLTTETPVLIKDVWRPEAKAVVPEVERYKTLHAKKVRNILTFLGGGDVGAPDVQRTITQTHDTAPDQHVPRVHARLVLKEICRPLEEFRNSTELATAMYSAFEG